MLNPIQLRVLYFLLESWLARYVWILWLLGQYFTIVEMSWWQLDMGYTKLICGHISSANRCISWVHFMCEWRENRLPITVIHSLCFLLTWSEANDSPTAGHAFFVTAPSIWNSFPADVLLCQSVINFRVTPKTHLFTRLLSSLSSSYTFLTWPKLH